MSRSELWHQYMAFQTPIDSRTILPLTLEEALDEWSLSPASNDHRTAKSYHALRPILAPPPSPIESFNISYLNCLSPDKSRGGSFSSYDTSPGMVEDHSGISDSEVDPSTDDDRYQGLIWKKNEKTWIKGPQELQTVYRTGFVPVYKPITPPMTSRPLKARHSQPKSKPKPICYPHGGILTPVDMSDFTPINNRCNSTQRSRYQDLNVQKSLPPTPSPSKRSKLRAKSNSPLPKRLRSTSRPSPAQPSQRSYSSRLETSISYDPRPSTSPSSSTAQPFSFNNTPPLPLISPSERSVFDYDSDDKEARRGTKGSKWHIRSTSSGTYKGKEKSSGIVSWGRKDAAKAMKVLEEGGEPERVMATVGSGRRRTASDVVLGIFGRKK